MSAFAIVNHFLHKMTMKRSLPLLLLLPALLMLFGCEPPVSQLSTPTNLMVEYRKKPFTDEKKPRFSWQMKALARDTRQYAYQVQVATSEDLLLSDTPDVWDSKKIAGNQSTNVSYKGGEIKKSTRYFWRVRIWDERDVPTDYSEISWWESTKLAEADWSAQWIGDGRKAPLRRQDHYKDIPNPIFRKAFTLTKPVQSARLYIAGLGYYEAFLNGERVGNSVLDPGWTNYGKRVLYSTYPADSLLQAQENVLAVSLGNGWYNPLPLGLFRKFNLREILTIGQPKLIAELLVNHPDGSQTVIKSDTTWKCSTGPLLRNNIYLGEKYDAREERPGWKTVGYDASEWTAAVKADPPGGKMLAQMTPPIRITKTIRPKAINRLANGDYVVDFGQNFAGWLKIQFRGTKPGTPIRMRYGELLFEDGSVNGNTTVAGHIKAEWSLSGGPGAPPTAYQEDTYITRGADNEVFQHTYTFHGFRYVQVSGYGGELAVEDLAGLRLNADVPEVGSFNSSNQQFNRIQEITKWTFLSNIFSIQSDCPGREKFGYGGDIVTAAEAYCYNYHMPNFYEKTVRDFRDDARPGGGMPETAPYNGIDSKGLGEGSGPVGWQLAYPYTQKILWDFYADRRILERNFPAMVRMVNFMESVAGDSLIYHGIGDHVSVDPKPVRLSSACFYYHNVKLLAAFADILNKSEQAKKYGEKASIIKSKINEEFLNQESGGYTESPTQITQAFALFYELPPTPEVAQNTLNLLMDEILKTHNGHLSTGIFGTKFLFDVLREHKKPNVAFTIVNQEEYPGYGYMLANGATTLWEHWDKSRNQNSKSHPMFGSVSEWFYRHLGGINPDPEIPGFEHILLTPGIPDSLEWVKVRYQSVKGEIRSEWKKEDGDWSWDVEIPGNTYATVTLPFPANKIREGEKKLNTVEGLEVLEQHEAHTVFSMGCGAYQFRVMNIE